MKDIYRKESRDKTRGSQSQLDLNLLENGSSNLSHSFTVNGLNFAETENLDRKVQSRSVLAIPFLVAIWYSHLSLDDLLSCEFTSPDYFHSRTVSSHT